MGKEMLVDAETADRYVSGSGPQELRRRLYDTVLANSPPFRPFRKNQFGTKWKAAHVSRILQKKDYEGADIEELEEKIRNWRCIS